MALLQRKSDEQRAAEAERKDERRREKEERDRLAAIERARSAFFRTPAGRARLAFERGHHVFQYEIDVMSQQAIIVAMVGSTTSKKTTDPVDVLNSVCREGWELVNGSFVFVEQGQQSRDKFMSSGQNVAIKGTTVGYYLFKRNEPNRQTPSEPWLAEDEDEPAWECQACGAEVDETAVACPNCGESFEDAEPASETAADT